MVIDPDDLEGFSEEEIERLTEDDPEELTVEFSGREEEPEEQFYDDYELPPEVDE
jgi:hypothetical protein